MTLTDDQLAALEAAVQRALASGDERELRVLGYGEVSAVLAWPDGPGGWACKRLPPFPGRDAFERYAAVFHDYLGALEQAGIRPVPSALRTLPARGEGLVAWCVQPRLAAEAVGPRLLAQATPEQARALLDDVSAATCRMIDGRRGLDAQISNWARHDGQLVYLDVTTPMLRDARGRDRLDTDLFLASLPWALRGIVRAFVLRSILDHYHAPRAALVDLGANLLKERLERHLPALLACANARVTPAIEAAEVRRYYTGDARVWAALQRLRGLDRAWQRRVRRRVYPFLLPGPIAR